MNDILERREEDSARRWHEENETNLENPISYIFFFLLLLFLNFFPQDRPHWNEYIHRVDIIYLIQ